MLFVALLNFFHEVFRDMHTSEFDWRENVISHGAIFKSNSSDSIEQKKAAGPL